MATALTRQTVSNTDGQNPNLKAVRCTTLQDGSVVQISIRPVSGNINILEIVANKSDGSPLYPDMADSPHLVLKRTERGTDVNKWLPEHVHMLGAPRGNGLSTAFLDFSADIVGLDIVRPTSPSPDRDKARQPFDGWQERRAKGEKIIFAECV